MLLTVGDKHLRSKKSSKNPCSLLQVVTVSVQSAQIQTQQDDLVVQMINAWLIHFT